MRSLAEGISLCLARSLYTRIGRMYIGAQRTPKRRRNPDTLGPPTSVLCQHVARIVVVFSMLSGRDFVATYSRLSVYAEYHNPSVLDPRFLAANGIVPDTWVHSEATNGWQYSEVRFQNNFTVSLGTRSFDIEDRRVVTMEGELSVFDVGSRYLGLMQFVNYQSLSVSIVRELEVPNASLFLTQRFLHPALRTDDLSYLRMDPRFRFGIGDWRVNLWFYPGSLTSSNGQTVESLAANVQATYDSVDSAESARLAIVGWPNIQEVIDRVANDLLGRNDDNVSEPC